jgi:hypothetical protein
MATPAAKPIRVKVVYDFRNGNFHTVPRKPRLKIKAYVEFYTDIKEAKVDVLLDPARAFRPAEYKTGQKKLIHVTKRFGKGMIWCGGTYPSPQGFGTPPITINPKSREYGFHIDDGSTP